MRIVGTIVALILWLVWKEAAQKTGLEGGMMGAIRGIVTGLSIYWIWVITKKLDTHTAVIENDDERQKRLLELSKQSKGYGRLKDH